MSVPSTSRMASVRMSVRRSLAILCQSTSPTSLSCGSMIDSSSSSSSSKMFRRPSSSKKKKMSWTRCRRRLFPVASRERDRSLLRLVLSCRLSSVFGKDQARRRLTMSPILVLLWHQSGARSLPNHWLPRSLSLGLQHSSSNSNNPWEVLSLIRGRSRQ